MFEYSRFKTHGYPEKKIKFLIPKNMKTKFLIPIAAIALFCACKGKGGGYEVVNNSSSADSDVSKKADTLTAPKLVKTAGMNFKVKNVSQTAVKINSLAN